VTALISHLNSALSGAAGYWLLAFIKIAALLIIVMTVNAYLTWFERKVVAHMQSRIGPHRVGPHGLLQPAADGLKFLFKEDAMPAGVDKFVYLFAPFLALTLSLASLAVIPFGPKPLPFPFFGGHQINLWIANPGQSGHRAADSFRRYRARRLRRRARRLGFQQQVSAARRLAQLGANGQL